jgi:hypothetical protein
VGLRGGDSGWVFCVPPLLLLTSPDCLRQGVAEISKDHIALTSRYSLSLTFSMTFRTTKSSRTQACSLTNLSLGLEFQMPVILLKMSFLSLRIVSRIRSELVTPAWSKSRVSPQPSPHFSLVISMR